MDLALRDLDAALDLDRDADGQLTWGEVQAARSAIDAYALGGLALAGCAAGFSVQEFGLERRADGVYAALHLQAPCALGLGAALRYTLLGEVDPMHRALLKTTRGQQASEVSLLHPRQPSHWMTPAAPASAQPVRAEPLTPVQALGTPSPPASGWRACTT